MAYFPTNSESISVAWRPVNGLLVALFFCLLLPWQNSHAANATAAQPGVDKSSKAMDLSQRSDQDLTELASEWDKLSPSTRRVLLKEMQQRMAQIRRGERAGSPVSSANGRSGASEGVLRIRTERRFGRRVRQSDGRVVTTIETRVVQLRTRPSTRPGNAAADQNSSAGSHEPAQVAVAPVASGPFGVGFERRSAQRRVIVMPRLPTSAGKEQPSAESQ